MAHPRIARGFILPVILATLFYYGKLKADEPLPLPGHDFNLDETAKHCYGALVATFEKVVSVGRWRPDALDYTTRWKVKQVLRGEYEPETELFIRVQTEPKPDEESLPTLDKTYILIGCGPEYDHNQMVIVLENTPKNLEKVKKLLQQ